MITQEQYWNQWQYDNGRFYRKSLSEFRSKQREYSKAYRLKHGDKLKEYQRKYRETKLNGSTPKAYKKWASRNPLHVKANRIIQHAIRDGKLIRPSTCSNCGITSKIYGHHKDYEKPLEVIWLCKNCHLDEHGGSFK